MKELNHAEYNEIEKEFMLMLLRGAYVLGVAKSLFEFCR